MHPIFSISVKQIQSLNDEVSRELVARLCKADLRTLGNSPTFVTWGGDQRAKDGGVDVLVDIDPPSGIHGYIINDRTAFQVKAEHFSGGKIPEEMAPKGIIRPALTELAAAGGAYVLVSTRDKTSHTALSARVKAMTDCLTTHGLTGKVTVDFYDCTRLADWIGQHPAVALWVRHILGTPIQGWRPYGGWAYQEPDANSEYLLDDRVKVFSPHADEGANAITAIDNLRSDLSKSSSCRIVGLSGVGKTRLVQALFDSRIDTGHPALDPDNVLYTNLSDDPTPQPLAMIEALISDKSDSVVVVDNCGIEGHKKLSEAVKRAGCKIRLITIEYDIRDDLPEGTHCYRLEGSSDEIIKKLLKQRYSFLSRSDLDKIAEFSSGNARVAFALASTTETTGELARLRDEDLFNRLFHQQNSASGELLRCAEVASLLYSFDGADTSAASELQLLSSLAEVTSLTFSRHIVDLQRRGLVQARTQWRAVLPHAIANRLAARAIESIPKPILIENLINNASNRVARSFSRRIGYLHELQIVRGIVQEWLNPDGHFGDLASLDEVGLQIFMNVAPVHQEAALNAIDRASLEPYLSRLTNHQKEQYVRIARSLAYEPALFSQAAAILSRFALAEKVGNNSNSASNMLKSLFYCHLSGTEALPEQRIQFVQDVISSEDEERQKLGLELLDAGLESWHFSSHYDFDFGARKRGYGWWPKNRQDVQDWFDGYIHIAIELARTKSPTGQKALAMLGESVRGLWVAAKLEDSIENAVKDVLAIGIWPEGWLGARRILYWDKDKISNESKQRLLQLEKVLAPRNLMERIKAKILVRGTFVDDIEEDGDDEESFSKAYHRSEAEAEDLGRALAIDDTLLYNLLPDLLKADNNNSKIASFGQGIGKEIRDPSHFLRIAKDCVQASGDARFNTLFMRGFVWGLHKSHPRHVAEFLDLAIADDFWLQYFPELQVQVPLDERATARLLKSLELEKTPIWQYQYLGIGRVTDTLSVEQISRLISAIAQKPGGGAETAVDVLAMVIRCANEKDDSYRSQLSTAANTFLRQLDWEAIERHQDRLAHDIGVILRFTLALPQDENDVKCILENLIKHADSGSYRYERRMGESLSAFFEFYPRLTLDAIYRGAGAAHSNKATQWVSSRNDERQETAIGKVPPDILIAWCNEFPDDRFLFAAKTCRLFEKQKDESSDELSISDVAVQVLGNAPDKAAVLEIFTERFHPNGWSGSLSAILSKRLQLLPSLNPQNDEKLAVQIEAAMVAFAKQIQFWQDHESTEERKESGSFE